MQKYIFQVTVELEAIDEDNAKEQIRKYCSAANAFSQQHPSINMFFTCQELEEDDQLREDAKKQLHSWNIRNMN
jgi:hypothetical protein